MIWDIFQRYSTGDYDTLTSEDFMKLMKDTGQELSEKNIIALFTTFHKEKANR